MPGKLSHANHPARLAAIAAGERRFKLPGQCPKPGHVWRYVRNGKCSDCDHDRITERREAAKLAKPPKKKPPRPTARETAIEKRGQRLPMIGADADVEITTRRLIKTNTKFLALLFREALNAIKEAR